MEKFKIYVAVDSLTGELLSIEEGHEYSFKKYKKDVTKEFDGKIKEAELTVKVKDIDY